MPRPGVGSLGAIEDGGTAWPGPPARLTGWARVAVPASLLASYLANDGEELLTMSPTMPAALARAPRWLPAKVRARRISQGEVDVAIALMGVLYAAAAIDGWRTAGRGRLYQNVQWAFGIHGFGHIGASVVTRGYTSGVVTSPLVVIPQWLWARRSMRAAGVPNRVDAVHAAILALTCLAASHLVASRVQHDRLGRAENGPTPTASPRS